MRDVHFAHTAQSRRFYQFINISRRHRPTRTGGVWAPLGAADSAGTRVAPAYLAPPIGRLWRARESVFECGRNCGAGQVVAGQRTVAADSRRTQEVAPAPAAAHLDTGRGAHLDDALSAAPLRNKRRHMRRIVIDRHLMYSATSLSRLWPSPGRHWPRAASYRASLWRCTGRPIVTARRRSFFLAER